MAVCLDPPMIVMQYYAHGSLFDLLKKARKVWDRAGGRHGGRPARCGREGDDGRRGLCLTCSRRPARCGIERE
eukprot:83283-Chlamydomonas_euryale.AAC.1